MRFTILLAAAMLWLNGPIRGKSNPARYPAGDPSGTRVLEANGSPGSEQAEQITAGPSPTESRQPAVDSAKPRIYDNRLRRLVNPPDLLADFPEFVAPIRERQRFESSPLVVDPQADLTVRAWRFSYNARGIIEMDNQLSSDATAVIMVHPWGIDDGQGWDTPEPAGVADFCTKEKNHLAAQHTRQVIKPLLDRLRPHVRFTMYSLPGEEDPIRKQLYRSVRATPTAADRTAGKEALNKKLGDFEYRGQPLPAQFPLSSRHPVKDYFAAFPGLDAGARYNNAGFWDLPIPVCRDVGAQPDDVVIYDAEGYSVLRDFLLSQNIRHVILTGYATDMCFCRTTAGYENLSQDFNVFLVGDATLATFPANDSPRHATNAAISFASLTQLVTQTSWIKLRSQQPATDGSSE